MSLVLTISQEVKLREMHHRALLASFEEKEHPRAPEGAPEGHGGQFVSKDEGGGGGGGGQDARPQGAQPGDEDLAKLRKKYDDKTKLDNYANSLPSRKIASKTRWETIDGHSAQRAVIAGRRVFMRQDESPRAAFERSLQGDRWYAIPEVKKAVEDAEAAWQGKSDKPKKTGGGGGRTRPAKPDKDSLLPPDYDPSIATMTGDRARAVDKAEAAFSTFDEAYAAYQKLEKKAARTKTPDKKRLVEAERDIVREASKRLRGREIDEQNKAEAEKQKQLDEQRRSRFEQEQAEAERAVERAKTAPPSETLGEDMFAQIKSKIPELVHRVPQGDADALAKSLQESVRWPSGTLPRAAREALKKHIEDNPPWIDEDDAKRRRAEDSKKDEDARRERERSLPRATDRQRSAIENMLERLSRVDLFDSFTTDGPTAAAQFRRELNQEGGISGRRASEMIDRIAFMIEDEM